MCDSADAWLVELVSRKADLPGFWWMSRVLRVLADRRSVADAQTAPERIRYGRKRVPYSEGAQTVLTRT